MLEIDAIDKEDIKEVSGGNASEPVAQRKSGKAEDKENTKKSSVTYIQSIIK